MVRPPAAAAGPGGTGSHAAHEVDPGIGSLMWMVNGQTFDPAVDLATPRLGDVEIWRLMTDLHHPVHLHLAPFQVLDAAAAGLGRATSAGRTPSI